MNTDLSESQMAGAPEPASNSTSEPGSGESSIQDSGQTQGSWQGQPGSHSRRRRRRRNKGGKTANGAPPQVAQGPSGQPAQQPQTRPQSQPAPPAAQGQSNPGQSSSSGGGYQGKKNKPKRFFPKGGAGNGNGGFNGNSNFNGNARPQNGNMRMQNGNPGNGNQAGRRKNKQKRQQVFVGPMDHSYRTVNGNVADSPGGYQEFRGMPHSGFYDENDVYGLPPAAPLPDDAPTRIFCFIEDLFFLAKIQEVSKKLGVKVAFVKSDKETIAQLTDAPERPSLIVFDLNNASAKPLTTISKLRAKLKRGTSIIGFLSHLQGDLKVKAVEAGCDTVMPRSAFSQNLPTLLRRYGIEEPELEAVQA
jgi:CheY-like chemotaxis protein